MSMLRSAHSLEQGTSGHSRQDERACSSETATFAVRTAYCCIHSTFGTSLPARRPRRIVLVCIEGLDIARTRRRDPFRARAHLDRRKQVRALHESAWQRGCATASTFKSARLDTLGTVGGPAEPQSLRALTLCLSWQLDGARRPRICSPPGARALTLPARDGLEPAAAAAAAR